MSMPDCEFKCETLSNQELKFEDVRRIRSRYVRCVGFERDGVVGGFSCKEQSCEPNGKDKLWVTRYMNDCSAPT